MTVEFSGVLSSRRPDSNRRQSEYESKARADAGPTIALVTGWMVVLYVVAFGLEVAGLALVAVDILAGRDRARQIRAAPGPR